MCLPQDQVDTTSEHRINVATVFQRIGYEFGDAGSDWDVLKGFLRNTRKEAIALLKGHIKPHQKVSSFNCICYTVFHHLQICTVFNAFLLKFSVDAIII